MKRFKINFCLEDTEYMTALRLVVGGVCSAAELDVDAVEDFKVCITECCLILKGCGFEEAEISLTPAKGGMSAVICGVGCQPVGCDNEFSLALVSALVTSVELERKGDAISKFSIVL